MTVATDKKAPEHPPRELSRVLFSVLIWGGLLAVLVWSFAPAEMYRFVNLFTDGNNMAVYASDFLRPDFRHWRFYLEEMLLTLQIAAWGTFLAFVFAVPFGILSSNNVVPWWVYQPVRRLMDAFRAINELVFAVLFIVAVGLGPFAGVMALFIHTTGILAKLFSEAVEAVDPRPVEGIRATGASKLQEIVYGIIRRFPRSGSPSRSTASNRTCAQRPCSGSSAPAASGRSCLRRCAVSSIPRRRRS